MTDLKDQTPEDLRNLIARATTELKNRQPDTFIKTVYLHGNFSEDGIVEDWKEEGIELSEEAMNSLYHMLYEVKIKLEINRHTGDYKILEVKE